MTNVVEYVNEDLERRAKRNFGDLSTPLHFPFLCATVGRKRDALLREIADAVEQGELDVEQIQFRAVQR